MRPIGAHVSSAGGLTNVLKNAQNIGADSCQFFAGSPRTWARSLYPQNQVDAFLETKSFLDFGPVFIHALYLVNLASADPVIIEKSSQSLLTDLKNADQINAVGVIIHIGSHLGRGFPAVKEQVISHCRSLLAQSQSTHLILENDAGQNGKIGSLEELSELSAAISHPRLRICLDSAHLFASGIDIRQSAMVDKLLADLDRLNLLPLLDCLHLNDSKSALGSFRDIHANLGQGAIGLDGLKLFINHPSLKHLPIILEVPGADGHGPDAENISTARSIAA